MTSWPRHTEPWLMQQSPLSLQSSEQEQRLRDNLFSPHLNLLQVHIRSRNKYQHNTFHGPNSTCPKWIQKCLWNMIHEETMDHFLTLSQSQNLPPQWSIWTKRKYAGSNYYSLKSQNLIILKCKQTLILTIQLPCPSWLLPPVIVRVLKI